MGGRAPTQSDDVLSVELKGVEILGDQRRRPPEHRAVERGRPLDIRCVEFRETECMERMDHPPLT